MQQSCALSYSNQSENAYGKEEHNFHSTDFLPKIGGQPSTTADLSTLRGTDSYLPIRAEYVGNILGEVYPYKIMPLNALEHSPHV